VKLLRIRKNMPKDSQKFRDEPIKFQNRDILQVHGQSFFNIKSDYSSILRKCKHDLEILKEQVVDFTRDLEIL